MISWVKFFLEATIETAKTARVKFENIIKLTNEMNNKIMELPIKPENSKKVIELLYNEPRVNRNIISEKTGIKMTTVDNIIKAFVNNGILVETTGFKRNQIYLFERYIKLF